MRLLLPFAAAALLGAAGHASAQGGDLEKRVKDLEMKMSAKEKGPENGKDASDSSEIEAYFDDGLRFRSDDGTFEGRLGAYLIHHSTFFVKENEADSIDTFSIKEAGIELAGRLWGAWEVFVSPRILPGGTVLYYGWAEFNKWEVFKIRAGIFKEPYSTEVLEHTKWQDMPENSLTSIFAPNRDVGAMVHGELAEGLFGYMIGVFNGNGAGGADENSDKDVAIRVTLNPGAKSDSEFLKHLYFSYNMTRGRQDKQAGDTPFSFEVPSTGQTFQESSATPGAGFEVDGDTTRSAADLAWCIGPVELKGEYAYFRQKMEFDDDRETFHADGWNMSVGFWIGGSRTPGKRPQIEKALFQGGFGGIQIVARYSRIYLDDDFQDRAGFAGTNHVREYAGCINWYPNEHVRISAMYANIEYGSERVGLAGGTVVDDENVWIIRGQVDF